MKKKLRYWSVLAQNLDLILKLRAKVVLFITVFKIIVKRQIRKVVINFKHKSNIKFQSAIIIFAILHKSMYQYKQQHLSH